MNCPNCREPLGEDPDAAVCGNCGWRRRVSRAGRASRAEEEPDSGDEPSRAEPDDPDDRPRRKRRRKSPPEDYVPTRRPPSHVPAIVPFLVVGLAAILGAVLTGLTFAAPERAYWLGFGGVALFIAGAAWGHFAAKADGIELWAPWGGTGVVAMFHALMQLVSIPVIACFHLVANPLAALPPALVLLMGIGMVASAFLLGR